MFGVRRFIAALGIVRWPLPGSLLPLSEKRAIGFMRFADILAASRLVRQQFGWQKRR
jgi:hypothetical protein